MKSSVSKGKHNPGRRAVRHGHENGEVTLRGRRVGVRRPRVRSADGKPEVPLVSYEHFAARDRPEGVVLERMLTGASPPKYRPASRRRRLAARGHGGNADRHAPRNRRQAQAHAVVHQSV